MADDDIITDLARALPELEMVRFGKFEECCLTELHVGYTHLPDESGSMVTEALAFIFPHLKHTDCSDRSWRSAVDVMMDAERFVDHTRNRPHIELMLTMPIPESLSKPSSNPGMCRSFKELSPRSCLLIFLAFLPRVH